MNKLHRLTSIPGLLLLVGASTNPIRRWDYVLRAQMPLMILSDEAGQLDAFGRLRISLPHTLFDSKSLFDKDSLFWSEKIANHSGSASSVLTSPNWRFTVGQNDTIIRQTRTWWNYQPGKSQLLMMTAALDTTAGLKSRLGQFNDRNGFFFEVRGSHLYAGFRTDGVDSLVADTDFNRDRLDGSGTSKIKIDYTKAKTYWICYEWLGAGSVLHGVVVEGIVVLNNGLGRIAGGLMSQSTRQSSAPVPANSAGWALGCKVDTTQQDTVALCFRPTSANADILGSWTWRELR